MGFIKEQPLDSERLWKWVKTQESGNSHWGLGIAGKAREAFGVPYKSPAGAVGIAQVTPWLAENLAKQYGFKYDKYRLEHDPAYNEMVGKIFFNHLVKKYNGDVPKILAGYNAGETNVDRAVREFGDNWLQNLPTRPEAKQETQNYVKKISDNFARDSQLDYIKRNNSVPDGVKIDLPQESHGPAAPQEGALALVKTNPTLSEQPPEKPTGIISRIVPSADAAEPLQQQPQQDILSAVRTDAAMTNPPIPGQSVDPTAFPGVDQPSTPYYDSQGATQSGVRPNESYLEHMGRQFKENLLDESTSNLMKMWAMWDTERKTSDSKKLSPEEANRMYPGLPEPFKEPVSLTVAQFVYNEYQDKKTNAAWNARGEQLGIVSNFVAGAAGFLADPVNLALTMATGGLVNATSVGKSLPKVARVVGENLIVGAETTGIKAAARKMEHDPLDSGEIAASLVMDTAFGTVFHYGLGILGDGIRGFKDQIKKTSTELQRQTLGKVIGKLEGGEGVSVAADAIASAEREAGRTPPGVPPHIHTPDPDIGSTRFYVSFDENGKPYTIGDSLDLVTAVDNPNSARNVGKTVRELALPEGTRLARLVDLISNSDISTVIDGLKKAGVSVPMPENATLGDYLRVVRNAELAGSIPEGSLKKVNAAFQEAGFAGYIDEVKFNDTPVSNRVSLFEPDKLDYGPSRPVDPEKVYNPPEEPQAPSPEPEQVTKLSEPVDVEKQGVPEHIRLEGERDRAELQALAESDPEIRDALAEIDDLERRESSAIKIVRALTNCGAGKFV